MMQRDFKFIFDKARKETLAGVNDWAGLMALSKRPGTKITDEMLEREGLIHDPTFDNMLYRIALASKSVFTRIIITSYKQGGKSARLYFLDKITKQESHLKGLLIPDSTLQGLQNLPRKLHYLLADNVNFNSLIPLLDYCREIPCVIVTMPLDEFIRGEFCFKLMAFSDEMREKIGKYDLFFQIYEGWDIIRINDWINKRFASFSIENTQVALNSIISQKSLDSIFQVSCCVPGWALNLLNDIIESQFESHVSQSFSIDDDQVQQFIKSSGFNNVVAVFNGQLKPTQHNIAMMELLKAGKKRPVDLIPEYKKKKAAISHQTSILEGLNFIAHDAATRKFKYFDLKPSGKAALEILKLRAFKETSTGFISLDNITK